MVHRRVSMGASLSGMESSPAVIDSDLVGFVLAAGAGRRLAPISDLRPKALCPVGTVPLVDLAIDRVAPHVGAVAVNVHHGRDLLEPHLRARGDVHVAVEEEIALGTAGALAALRGWFEGRSVVVVNADGWTPEPIGALVDEWDGRSVRVMVAGDDELRDDSLVVGCALPSSVVDAIPSGPGGLFEMVWRDARVDGRIEVVRFEGTFVDCGTPEQYLDANLRAAALAGGALIDAGAIVGPGARVERSVVGSGARIEGELVDSVVWDGQSVTAGESLVRSLRVGPSTTVVVEPVRRDADARN